MAHGIYAVRRMPTDGVGTLDLKPLAGKGSNNPGEQPACVLDGRQPLQVLLFLCRHQGPGMHGRFNGACHLLCCPRRTREGSIVWGLQAEALAQLGAACSRAFHGFLHGADRVSNCPDASPASYSDHIRYRLLITQDDAS